MLKIRRDHEIHQEEGGWFQARWHFSFSHYRDPEHDGIGPLRVFNDDRLVPGAIWPLHPHRDVEGLTYVVEGSFLHEDNVGGNPGPLPAGSVQRMTLGSGALHSEQNASTEDPMRFIQIWILPSQADLTPEVEQKVFTTTDRTNRLLEVINPQGAEGAVKVHGDARVCISRLEEGVEAVHRFQNGWAGYLYLIEGAMAVEGERLETGDAAEIYDQPQVRLEADTDSELILVEVPTTYEPVGVWAGN